MSSVKRTIKDYLWLLLKGSAMGAADVVPGVSGGTVAFITGIYDELLHSLKQIGPKAVVVLFKEGIGACWNHINGWFLLCVFGGILLSLKTFAAILIYALEVYPILVWALFSGLLIGSLILLVKAQEKWRAVDVVLLLVGAAVVFGIAVADPIQLNGKPWVLFLGGFIAICAMILPGISGSFILLLLGLYPIFLEAIHSFNLIALASFGAGCVCGLMVFSHFLSWLLSRFHQATLSVLIGFLVGSLYVTWPWKQVVSTRMNSHGELVPFLQQNVLPSDFQSVTHLSAQLPQAIAMMVLGLVLVLTVEWLSKKSNRR